VPRFLYQSKLEFPRVGPGPNYIKTPFINNQLPLFRESPLAKYMFGATPSPTNNLSPLVGNNLTALAPVN
jgi:hypothetical protein